MRNVRPVLSEADSSIADLTEHLSDDGYRLTYGGYDYLALHALTRSDALQEVGSTMGVGKESDIILVTSPSPIHATQHVEAILKIHRLGRTSFRTVANNRSYLGKRLHTSWQYLSRLSAQREVNAMRLLYDAGIKVPRPIGHSRHAIVMNLVPGAPLRAVPLASFGRNRREQEARVGALYGELMEIVLSLAERGIIHGDMNEFNIMLAGIQQGQAEPDEDGHDEDDDELEDSRHERTALQEKDDEKSAESPSMQGDTFSTDAEDLAEDARSTGEDWAVTPYVIDFPQVTSMSHPQASEYFERDVDGIKAFFRKRYHFESDDPGPTFEEAASRLAVAAGHGIQRLDAQMEAAGFNKKMAKQLSSYYAGAEVDLNDIEVDFPENDSTSLVPKDPVDSVGQSLSEMRMGDAGRQKAAAGWSL
ncbi:MAG: hypothetical protein Q9162_000307 [Coniocarpon cinnabarinum]